MTINKNPSAGAAGHVADHKEIAKVLQNDDLLANRPTVGTQGRWYHATDTGQLFREDGSAWHEVPSMDATALAWTGKQTWAADGFFASGRPWLDVMADRTAVGGTAGCKGDGSTNDFISYQDKAYAVPSGGILYHPNPTAYYRLERANAGPVLSLFSGHAKDIAFIGPEGCQPKIKLGPEATAYNVWFCEYADGVNVRARNLNIEGRDNANNQVDLGFLGGTYPGPTTTTLTLENVTMTKFAQPIKGQGDPNNNWPINHTITVRNSLIKALAYGNCILIAGGTVYLRGSTFDAEPGPVASFQPGHNLYLAWGVALDANDCDFKNTSAPNPGAGFATGGYNVQWNDSSIGVVARTPAFCVLVNCRFTNSTASANCVLTHPYAVTTLVGCTFNITGASTSAINARNEVELIGCSVLSDNLIQAFGSSTITHVLVDSGVYKGSFQILTAGGEWTFSGAVRLSGVTHRQMLVTDSTVTVNLDNAIVERAPTTATEVIYWQNGNLRLGRVKFLNGASGSSLQAILITGGTVTGGRDCSYQDPNNAVICATGAGVSGGQIEMPAGVWPTPVTTTSSATGAYISGSNLVLPMAANVFHLAPASPTTIGFTSRENFNNNQRAYGGGFSAIHDNANTSWSGASVNTKPAITTARTANSAAQFVTDSGNGTTYGMNYEIGAR